MGQIERLAIRGQPLELREIEILDAAATAFMRQGFAGTSIDRISDAMHSTKGTIYYYYRSKSELFFAVYRRGLLLTEAAIRPPFESEGTPRERLHRMAVAHTLLVMNHLPYLRVIAQGLELHLLERTSEADRAELEQVNLMRKANERLYIKVIEEGIRAGEFRPLGSALIVKPLLGALNWTSRWYQPRPRETAAARNKVAHAIADFVVSGMEQARIEHA